MKFTRDIIGIGLILLLLLVAGGFYAYKEFKPTSEELDTLKYDRIATLSIKKEDMDEATRQQFTEFFNNARAVFLSNPGSIEVFFQVNTIGRIKQDVGDYAGAEEAFLHAYSLDPGGYIINGNLANLYQYGLHDYTKAEEYYLKTLAIPNIQEGNQYTYFAELYELYQYRMEQSTKADELIDRAIKELPENINILSLAAEHYKRTSAFDRAKSMYERILEVDPQNQTAKAALKLLQ